MKNLKQKIKEQLDRTMGKGHIRLLNPVLIVDVLLNIEDILKEDTEEDPGKQYDEAEYKINT